VSHLREMTAKDTNERASNALFKYGSMLFVAVFVQLPIQASAWGSSSNEGPVYGLSSLRSEWTGMNSIAIKVTGCTWGTVGDREDAGCMDDESEDGTDYWNQMANCRRAQVTFDVFASSGTTSCGNSDFKESLYTTYGVAEFAYIIGAYSSSSPPVTGDDVDGFPVCEEDADGDGLYVAISCGSETSFTIDKFSDQYCTGGNFVENYDTLTNFNKALHSNNLDKCYAANSLIDTLLKESTTCSAWDSSLCTTSDFAQNAASSGFVNSNNYRSNGEMQLANKLKYGLGGSMLLGSVIMFFGILFTNRRKRRALMHRKFRNGPSSRSKSKSKKSSGGSTRSKRKKKKDSSSRSGGGVLA